MPCRYHQQSLGSSGRVTLMRVFLGTFLVLQGIAWLPLINGQQFGQPISQFQPLINRLSSQRGAEVAAPAAPRALPSSSVNVIQSLSDQNFLNTFRTLFNRQRGAAPRTETPVQQPTPALSAQQQNEVLLPFGARVPKPAPAVVQSNFLSFPPSGGVGSSSLSLDPRVPSSTNNNNGRDRVDGVLPRATPRPAISSLIQSVQDARLNFLTQQQGQSNPGVLGNLQSSNFFFPPSSNFGQPTAAPAFPNFSPASLAQFTASAPAFQQPSVVSSRFFSPSSSVTSLPTAALSQVTLPPGLSEQLTAVTRNVQEKPAADRAKVLEDAGRIQGLLAQLIRAQTDLETRRTSATPPAAFFVRTSPSTTTSTTTTPRPPLPQPIRQALSPIIITGSDRSIFSPVREFAAASRPVVLAPPGSRFPAPTLKQLQEAIPISLPRGLDPNLNFDVQTFFEVFERERAANLAKLAITSTPVPLDALNEIIPPAGGSGSFRTDAGRRIETGSMQQLLTPGGVVSVFPKVAPILKGKSPEEQERLASDTLNVLSLLNEIRRAQSILGDTETTRATPITTSAPATESTTQRVEVIDRQPEPATISSPLPEKTLPASSTIAPVTLPVTQQPSKMPGQASLPAVTTTVAPTLALPQPPVVALSTTITETPSSSTSEVVPTTLEPTTPASTTVAGIPIATLLGGNDAISIALPNPNRKGTDDLFLPPIVYRPPANETLPSFLGRICTNFRCGVRFIRVNENTTQLSLKLRPIKGSNVELPDFLRTTTTEAPITSMSPTVPPPPISSSISPAVPPTPAQENPLVKSLCSRFKCNFRFLSSTTEPTFATGTRAEAVTVPSITGPLPELAPAPVEASTLDPAIERTTVAPAPSTSSKKPKKTKAPKSTPPAEPPTTPVMPIVDVTTPSVEPAAELVPMTGNSELPNQPTEFPSVLAVTTIPEANTATDLPLTETPAASAGVPAETMPVETATDLAQLLPVDTSPPAEFIDPTAESPLPSLAISVSTPRILPEMTTAPTLPTSGRRLRRPLSHLLLGNRGGRQNADVPSERPSQLVSELQGFYFSRLYSTLFDALAGNPTRQQPGSKKPL